MEREEAPLRRQPARQGLQEAGAPVERQLRRHSADLAALSPSSRRRVRHHVNPLNFRRPVEVPDWSRVFARPDQPLEVDVGCMHGTFLLEQARRTPQHNFVGLEIRAPLVREVEGRIEAQALDNVFALLCNANTSFRELFPPSSLRRVYVHFPDPWFKTRHHKRRVMTPDFVDALAERLAPGGELVFMTDYEEYATKVVELLEAHPAYRNAHGAGQPAPPDPERAQTNREAWHASQGDPIHRYRWVRREDA